MLPAQTIDEFTRLLERRALSSLFLDTGYNRRFTGDIIEYKEIFDEHVGDAWDIIFPCASGRSNAGGYLPSELFNPDDFDGNLSRKLLKIFNVVGRECPAIVFFGYDQSDYFIYPLKRLRGEWQEHFYEIGEIALKSSQENGHLADVELKAQTMREVRNYLGPRFRFETVGRVTGLFAQVVGAASSAVSMLK
ncbi:hypothetical protein [uncultured Paracoccus sp.]|uniref:hypothetical protein n=1 Tax=uncultured Paracoccus sp. TaxID=189685 RepID=UPI002619ADF8|nr:hypothetical protein [uncultured Paracoccus sp.]